jgi:uncharacterized protein YaaN involved in tellurite resistance
MSSSTNPVAEQLRHTLDEIKKLSDELRLEIHLGTMELKDKWNELEPQIWKAEQASRETALELVASLRRLRDSLKAKKQS